MTTQLKAIINTLNTTLNKCIKEFLGDTHGR